MLSTYASHTDLVHTALVRGQLGANYPFICSKKCASSFFSLRVRQAVVDLLLSFCSDGQWDLESLSAGKTG